MILSGKVGITSCGVYIPWHRLEREKIAVEWQTSGKGEKAVANYDENSLTMSVEAVRNCARVTGFPIGVDALYFCSTTPPYLEKQNAATIAQVFEIAEDAMTLDVGGSLRSGTQGVILGVNAILSGTANKVIVCAADKRLSLPDGESEMSFGDAAVAFCLGNKDLIASIEGIYTLHQEIISTWRSDRDLYVRNYESRFGLSVGYNRIIPKAVKAGLESMELSQKDIDRVVIYGANEKQIKSVSKKIGFTKDTVIQDSLFSWIGNTGTAQVPLTLASALEESNQGDRILLVNYSDGCDVIVLKVEKNIVTYKEKCRSLKYFKNNKNFISYTNYLKWRDIIPIDPPLRPQPEKPSASALWRDNCSLGLIGRKCENCGTIQYPPVRVCIECGSKDKMSPYRLSDKTGEIVAYSHDNLATGPIKTTTITSVDFKEGGRVMCDATDINHKDIRIGTKVEMTFRVLRHVEGIYDYWWKARPVR